MIKSKGVKNLSETSIRKIRRMIAAVLAEPKLFNQNVFCQKIDWAKGATPCNTVCCGAGWAVWLDNKDLYKKMMKKEISGAWIGGDWVNEALKALDLQTDGEGDESNIFGYADEWPFPFCDQYARATTAKARAKAFARRWEKFISSDGRV